MYTSPCGEAAWYSFVLSCGCAGDVLHVHGIWNKLVSQDSQVVGKKLFILVFCVMPLCESKRGSGLLPLAQRPVGGVMLEEVEEEGRGEERGVKNEVTFTRGAATPSGTFKGATLIVLDRAPTDFWTDNVLSCVTYIFHLIG